MIAGKRGKLNMKQLASAGKHALEWQARETEYEAVSKGGKI